MWYPDLMHEGPPTEEEGGKESYPGREEVLKMFLEFVGESEYEEVRQCEDEEGLYLWDIVVEGEDGNTEYSYMRQGHYAEGEASETAIHVTYTDGEGIPVGGHSVAKYRNGEWMLTP